MRKTDGQVEKIRWEVSIVLKGMNVNGKVYYDRYRKGFLGKVRVKM